MGARLHYITHCYMNRINIFNLLLTVAFCFGSSCTPDEMAEPDETMTPDNPGSSITIVNEGLTGRLFAGNGDYFPAIIDIPTGSCETVVSSEWDDNPDHSDFAVYSAYISADGTEILETIDRCEGFPEEKACFIIRDLDGNILSEFDVVADLDWTAKLSPDKSTIAFLATTDDWDSQLSFYSRDGNHLGTIVRDDIQTFDWHPGNLVVFSADNEFYAYSPAVAEPSYLISITGDGTVKHLSFSHDGNKLAFKFTTIGNLAADYGDIYVLDLETNELHRVAIGTEEEPNLNFPIWSPDGNWLTVTLGGVAGATEGHLFVVPSAGIDTVVDLDVQSEAIPILSYHKYLDSASPGVFEFELSTTYGSDGPGNRWLE